MKKFLTILMTIIFEANVFAGEVYAKKTPEEKAAAKDAKEMKKRAKAVAKQIKKINLKKIEDWANAGDIQAQFILAYAYHTGQRVHTSYKTSDMWKEEIAKQNEFFAEKYMPEYFGRKKLKLSELFGLAALQSHFGDYVKPSFEDSVRWAELGYSEKDLLSTSILGAAYYTGRGVRQDYKKAIELLKQAKNEPIALMLLADAYGKGNGVDKDLNRSKIYTDFLKLQDDKTKQKLKKFFDQYRGKKYSPKTI